MNVKSKDYTIERFVGLKECRKALESVYSCKIQYGYCGEFVYEKLGKKWYENHLYKMYKINKIHDHVLFSKGAMNNINYSDLLKTSWFDPKNCEYRINLDLNLPENMDVYILSDRVLTIFSEEEITAIQILSQKYRDYELTLHQALFKNSIKIEKFDTKKALIKAPSLDILKIK